MQHSGYLTPIVNGVVIDLSFERPNLMEGLNLMIAKSAKSADFGLNCEFQQKPQILQI